MQQANQRAVFVHYRQIPNLLMLHHVDGMHEGVAGGPPRRRGLRLHCVARQTPHIWRKRTVIEALLSDEIVDKFGGRFKLTALIQKRLQELIEGARQLVDRHGRSEQLLVRLILDDLGGGMRGMRGSPWCL